MKEIYVVEFTLRERLLALLDGKKVDRLPVVAVTQTGTVDLIKASGAMWPEAHRKAAPMA